LYITFSAGLFNWAGKKGYFDSLYFTVINVTTVGLGDIVPVGVFGLAAAAGPRHCGKSILVSQPN